MASERVRPRCTLIKAGRQSQISRRRLSDSERAADVAIMQTERTSVDVVGSTGDYEHPAARYFVDRTRAVTFKIDTNGCPLFK
ncbi:hypothetical protein J6590_006704 [Homalodisca vitripennis]|nr:hypothetical protein J6590_006704 [Homalodisca vitripennis]